MWSFISGVTVGGIIVAYLCGGFGAKTPDSTDTIAPPPSPPKPLEPSITTGSECTIRVTEDDVKKFGFTHYMR